MSHGFESFEHPLPYKYIPEDRLTITQRLERRDAYKAYRAYMLDLVLRQPECVEWHCGRLSEEKTIWIGRVTVESDDSEVKKCIATLQTFGTSELPIVGDDIHIFTPGEWKAYMFGVKDREFYL